MVHPALVISDCAYCLGRGCIQRQVGVGRFELVTCGWCVNDKRLVDKPVDVADGNPEDHNADVAMTKEPKPTPWRHIWRGTEGGEGRD